MIVVRPDLSLVPREVLAKAEAARDELETLPADQRASYINSKAAVWRAFNQYLLQMSHGKCWYSESKPVQSFFEVDHYRPKLEAKRSATEVDPGYEWLAFSFENLRLSAPRSNRLSNNEDTNVTEGKGSWFPLLPGSPKACWDNRCEATEQPVLLDPVQPNDVALLDVGADGEFGPSRTCVGSALVRVEESIKRYGLNLPRLQDARKKVMRDVVELHDILCKTLEAGGGLDEKAADRLPVQALAKQLKEKTLSSSPFARAARAQMRFLGIADLSAQLEDVPAT